MNKILSKKNLKFIFLILLILAVLLLSGCTSSAIQKLNTIKNSCNNYENDTFSISESENNKSNSEYNANNNTTNNESTKNVGELIEGVVTRHTDGDTFYVSCYDTRIRLIGVNCAEAGSDAGEAATTFTNSKVPIGTKVWLEKDVSETDTFGRPLRYVWLEKPGSTVTFNDVKTKMLNGILVANGHATHKEYPPDTKYAEWFIKIG